MAPAFRRIASFAAAAMTLALTLAMVFDAPAFDPAPRGAAGADLDRTEHAGQPGPEAPALEPNKGWLNTDRPLELDDELRGHVVLLDFWTYCCINCMHVLPDLEYLEDKYADEPFIVVGVHSAKFETEGERRSIRNAMFRYGIDHPVVVDQNMSIWNRYGARAWPTFVLIDPRGNVVGSASGEGQRDLLDRAIERTLEQHRDMGTLAERKVEYIPDAAPRSPSGLHYPGKVLAVAPADGRPGRLLVADSSNDRVVAASWPDERGRSSVVTVFGSGRPGLRDGPASEARFHDPQGMAFDPETETVYVADTRNHAVRAIDLRSGEVSTIAGTGEQGNDRAGGNAALEQRLSSPWALTLAPDRSTLYVAMAGLHQLWSIDMTTPRRPAEAIAGSGRENVIDGPARRAALAQPSGLALSGDGRILYFADTEGSAIRALNLDDRTVRTIIGRAVDSPYDTSLFDFGDVDGTYPEARLQHAIGITRYPTPEGERLLIADTYNDRLKLVDPASRRVTSWLGTPRDEPTPEGAPQLEEPAGLHFQDGTLFVADTNRHRVVMIDPATKDWREIAIEGLGGPQTTPASGNGPRPVPDAARRATIASGARTIRLEARLPRGYALNAELPITARISAIEPGPDGPRVGRPIAQTTFDPGRSFPLELALPGLGGPDAGDTRSLGDGPRELLIEVGLALCDDAKTTCYPADAVWRVTRSADSDSSTLRTTIEVP